MVYEKYVMELGWHIELFPVCKAALPQTGAPQDKGTAAALVMLQSLAAWLQVSFTINFQTISFAMSVLTEPALALLHN